MKTTFLKWAGGKQSVAKAITAKMNLDNVQRFFEPFAGSGALSLTLQNSMSCAFILNDINPDLMNVWEKVIFDRETFVSKLHTFFDEHPHDETVYYRVRDLFNTRLDGALDQAIYFVWLNRHGFNGLCRYNKQGKFNAPFGRYTTVNPPSIPKLQKIFDCSSTDYTQFLNRSFSDYDVIYVDPPYVPAKVGQFTSYSSYNWSEKDDVLLAETLFRIKKMYNTRIFVSNSCCDTTRAIYVGATAFHEIVTKRSVSANAELRGNTVDYLIEL